MIHQGSDVPLYFSHNGAELKHLFTTPPNPVYPLGTPTTWRPQLPCYLINSNDRTHQVIKSNLHRAPLFTGIIKAAGPRYCPSVEDKIVRFSHKESHPFFLEPEGWETSEVYVQGANTSLPEDVQWEMLRTIPALERVEITRVGYAIEYDYVPPSQTTASLESKTIPGLFCAGQVNGTTGYEEAAAQGLIAGINAVLKIRGEQPLIIKRDEGYIGVMIDDLITRELTEPYRVLTSRAEYRLLLRQDNADTRLTPIGYKLGLISKERYEAVEAKKEAVVEEKRRLFRIFIPADAGGVRHVNLAEYLRRPEVNYQRLTAEGRGNTDLSAEVRELVEVEVKYEGYIEKQFKEVERVKKLEERHIPPGIDYDSIKGLRTEACQKLKKFRPFTVGQASRLEGVTPADITILLIALQK